MPRKPVTLYRAGIHTPETRAAKTDSLRTYRRELADAEFPPAARQKVLQAIREGIAVPDAARAVNVSHMAVYGRARWDEVFSDELEAALEHASQRTQSDACGTPNGYRRRKCRCRRCRLAHNEETARYRHR